MKQTAVEWLEEQIHYLTIDELKTQIILAKEMEKQQIIESYEDGYSDSDNNFPLNSQYYNEIFKKE